MIKKSCENCEYCMKNNGNLHCAYCPPKIVVTHNVSRTMFPVVTKETWCSKFYMNMESRAKYYPMPETMPYPDMRVACDTKDF